jgi:gas vesicle protein
MNLQQIGKYLDTTREIVKRQIKEEKKILEFQKLIDVIKWRKNNPDLNLAVIGQFSSGKSTFINGLCRYNLLKAKNEVSTAAAAYLSKGRFIQLKVVFLDDFPIEADELDYKALQDHLERFHYHQLGDRRDLLYFIELLTANREIAASVTRLDITFPFPNDLLDDVTIIDTPGLFAGAEHATTHENITRAVIDNSADLVIFLIPAHEVMSRSLREFMADLPPYLLQRCIFIISRMDMIGTEEEREELIGFTRSELQEKLKLDNPWLFSCSAVSVLPQATKVIPEWEEVRRWQAAFQELEAALKAMLVQNKPLIIEEKLKFLLLQLLGETSKAIAEEEKLLFAEQVILKSQAVTSVQETLKGLLANAKKEIDKKGNQLRQIVTDFKPSVATVKSSAADRIRQAGSGIYGSYASLESQLHQEIRAEIETLVRTINSRIKELSDLCKALSSRFEQQFKANYSSLAFLNRPIKVDGVQVSGLHLQPYNFSSFQHHLETKNEEKANGQKAGAVAGFLGGLLIGGPIGAIIGAVAGGATGNKIAQESLETLQPKLIGLLNKEIDNCFIDAFSLITEALNNQLAMIKRQYDKLCTDHIDRYGADIQKLIDEHERKAGKLHQQMLAADRDKQQVSAMINDLNTITIK